LLKNETNFGLHATSNNDATYRAYAISDNHSIRFWRYINWYLLTYLSVTPVTCILPTLSAALSVCDNVMGCLHDPANVQQTSSKCI